MGATRKTNLIELAVLRLVAPFWGKPRITSWLVSYLREADQLEQTIFDTFEAFALGSATGDQLEILGRIVGVQREPAEQDLELRARIRARIRSNRSNGTPRDVHDVTALMLTDSGAAQRLLEFLVSVWVLIDGAVGFSERTLASEIRRAKAAGVNAQILTHPFGGLRFSHAPNVTQPAAEVRDQLESTANPGTGGTLYQVN